MFEVLKPLIESSIISEEVQQELQEAWDSKLTEAREVAKAELREEFAERYDHDKAQLVEALDSMVTDSLTQEINEFVEDKKGLAKDRVAYRKAIKENSQLLDKFITKTLANEMKEFRAERGVQTSALKKLEDFTIKALSEEIAEFAKDKQEVIETKVRLVKESTAKFEELKKQFIARSAKLVNETVTQTMKKELTQLKEDITQARENQFGRKIFEAIAAEYHSSYLNEGTQVAKLTKLNSAMVEKLAEAKNSMKEKDALVESKNAEIRIVKDASNRKEVMNGLVGSLASEKRDVMEGLLESVKTEDLRASFRKYLPAVLDSNGSGIKRRPLNESTKTNHKAVTGNKVSKKVTQVSATQDDSETDAILKLAGLK
jgi:hypothetical protein